MLALILDTECTGLIDNRIVKDERLPEVIEFYAELVNLDNGALMSSLERLCKPTRAITQEIVDITGITNEMVADQPPFSLIAPTLFTLIETSPRVIAHNMTYDKECLDIEAQRLNYQIKWPQLICSVEQTVHLTGRRLTLSALYQHLFKEKFKDAHRAKNDVKALTQCCVELYRLGEL